MQTLKWTIVVIMCIVVGMYALSSGADRGFLFIGLEISGLAAVLAVISDEHKKG